MSYHVIGFGKRLRDVFDESEHDLHVHLLRLFALYEDLRVEVKGFDSPNPIVPLDLNGLQYRRKYFFRRSVATLYEFSSAVADVGRTAAMKAIVGRMSADNAAAWRASLAYFDKHRAEISRLRNDFGAHVGHKTGKWLIKNLGLSAADALVEVHDEGSLESYRFRFANELVALTMCKQMPAGNGFEQYIPTLYDTVTQGWKEATAAVHVLWGTYLMDRIYARR